MKLFISIFLIILLGTGCTEQTVAPPSESKTHMKIINFPSDRYPKTAKHIKAAISKGETDECTIDRKGAEQNREDSLKGIPTKKGYDRDEWPMAMCKEGGKGSDVDYVKSSDNRGSGSWVGNQLEDFKDGTKVKFIVK